MSGEEARLNELSVSIMTRIQDVKTAANHLKDFKGDALTAEISRIDSLRDDIKEDIASFKRDGRRAVNSGTEEFLTKENLTKKEMKMEHGLKNALDVYDEKKQQAMGGGAKRTYGASSAHDGSSDGMMEATIRVKEESLNDLDEALAVGSEIDSITSETLSKMKKQSEQMGRINKTNDELVEHLGEADKWLAAFGRNTDHTNPEMVALKKKKLDAAKDEFDKMKMQMDLDIREVRSAIKTQQSQVGAKKQAVLRKMLEEKVKDLKKNSKILRKLAQDYEKKHSAGASKTVSPEDEAGASKVQNLAQEIKDRFAVCDLIDRHIAELEKGLSFSGQAAASGSVVTKGKGGAAAGGAADITQSELPPIDRDFDAKFQELLDKNHDLQRQIEAKADLLDKQMDKIVDTTGQIKDEAHLQTGLVKTMDEKVTANRDHARAINKGFDDEKCCYCGACYCCPS